MDHRGTDDMLIHVLEFIKKAPSSELAAKVRNKLEKWWFNLLRCPATQGLHIED